MAKICYIETEFRDDSLAIIDQANAIIEDYQGQGYTLTLRQLYYQFVAKALIPNTERSYKRIGSIVNNARLAGLIDWEAIEDKTRNLQAVPTWESPQSIIRACASQYRVDRWWGQRHYVEVWVEKDALTGVVERPCRNMGVPWFACRGYVSQSEMWSAFQRIEQRVQCLGSDPSDPTKAVILYLGDHDPSGLDMTRDVQERLDLFNGGSVDLQVQRIALTWDQIQQYQPPPNPAKLTDSRASGYVQACGGESWELDALSPSVLSGIVLDAIMGLLDQATYQDRMYRERRERSDLESLAYLTHEHWERLISNARRGI